MHPATEDLEKIIAQVEQVGCDLRALHAAHNGTYVGNASRFTEFRIEQTAEALRRCLALINRSYSFTTPAE